MEGFGWFGEFVGGESRVGRGEMGCGGKGGGILGQIYVPIGHFLRGKNEFFQSFNIFTNI